MKTSISTLAKSLMAAVVLSASIFSTNVMATEKQPAKIYAAKNYNKVIVSGNVEVTLIQNGTEGISYADNNTGKVKVIQDGSALKITSADNGEAKIIVYVKNIYRVMAADDAVVKTDGKLNVKYLQVFLSGNAVAKIDSKTESLYTVMEDRSDLVLSGGTQKHILAMGETQRLNLNSFAALQTEMNTPETTVRVAALSK